MPIASIIKASDLEIHTAILTSAFDQTWAKIEASGSPLAKDDNQVKARMILAKWIIVSAEAGERDVNKLVESAILHMATLKLPLQS